MRQSSRIALPFAAAILGFLAVLAAAQPRTAPGRESRRIEMADLITQQGERVQRLRAEVRELEGRLGELQGAGDDATVERLHRAADRLAVLAGGASLEGPGVTAVLKDSSASTSPTGDPNDLVIHEQDIQTVVNALWAAGAEAVSINGERLTSASAVRCAGNTLLLHGEVHSPPYEIQAIGDAGRMTATLSHQAGMGRLLADVRTFGLGFELIPGDVTIPGRNVTSVDQAVPAA